MNKKFIYFYILFITIALCSGWGWGKLYFSGNEEKDSNNILELSDKIIYVAFKNEESSNVIHIKYLSDIVRDPLLEEADDILHITENIVEAEGSEKFSKIIFSIYEPSQDQHGNKSQTFTLSLSWNISQLKTINFDSFKGYMLIDISTPIEFGPFAKNAITEYCRNGSTSYGECFCANFTR